MLSSTYLENLLILEMKLTKEDLLDLQYTYQKLKRIQKLIEDMKKAGSTIIDKDKLNG